MASVVTPVPASELPEWPTKRLLALRDRLLHCEESLELSDVQDLSEIDPSVIRFREDPRWSELYEATLAILNTREHVPRGLEQKARRKTDAAPRTRDRKPRPKRGGR
jgi:hypothetical protein